MMRVPWNVHSLLCFLLMRYKSIFLYNLMLNSPPFQSSTLFEGSKIDWPPQQISPNSQEPLEVSDSEKYSFEEVSHFWFKFVISSKLMMSSFYRENVLTTLLSLLHLINHLFLLPSIKEDRREHINILREIWLLCWMLLNVCYPQVRLHGRRLKASTMKNMQRSGREVPEMPKDWKQSIEN